MDHQKEVEVVLNAEDHLQAEVEGVEIEDRSLVVAGS